MIEPTSTSSPVALQEASAETDAPRYYVDTTWFAENRLSFEEVARARLCDLDRERVGEERQERVPVFDETTGRMRVEARTSTLGSDPLRTIRDHCGRQKNYVTRDMPTLEVVFRVLLANDNQPMTLAEVRDHLAEWCPGGGCQWLLLPIESLDRLVKNDVHYGLRQAS